MIRVYDRRSSSWIEEKVYGGSWVNSAYGGGFSPLRACIRSRAIQKLVSQGTGWFYSHPRSASLIPSFIKNYGIDMSEYQTPVNGHWNHFNEFFIRKFREGARSFPQEPQLLGAPAEGRLSVFPLTSLNCPLNIKGQPLSLAALVGAAQLAEPFVGGHAFVFRLCPVDYHRFHFPDDGRAGPSQRLGNSLHSVNPQALSAIPDIFLQNERQICLFESRHFGQMILLEIGALCVGKIHQSYEAGAPIRRGAEKGYFTFGASTTLLLTQKLWVQPDADLLQKSSEGFECHVRLGEKIGTSLLKV